MKKFISLVLAAAVSGGAVSPVGVLAAAEYEDFVPGAKTANLITNVTAGAGSVFLTTRNDSAVDNSDFYTPGINEGGYCFKYYHQGETALVPEGPWRIFSGFEIKTMKKRESGKTYSMTFDPQPGKTYVVSAHLKNASAEGVVPYFGVAMNGTYSPANAVVSNEYGEKGMAVGDEWTEFSASLTLPEDYAIDGHDWAKCLFAGFPEGTAPGAGVWVDVSDKDAFYLAEEQAYDIEVKAKGKTTAERGDSITVSAELVNQIGTKGALAQSFDWVLLDSQRNPVTEGFVLSETGGEATVTVENSAKNGTYYLYAKSLNYEMGKACAIEVTGEEEIDAYEDYVPGEKPENLITDPTVGGGSVYLGNRNDSAIKNGDWYTAGMAESGYAFKYFYDGTSVFKPEGAWRIFSGFEVKTMAKTDDGTTHSMTFDPKPGKNYVVSAYLKNASAKGVVPYFGVAMNGTYNPANAVVSNEYGEKGMAVGDEWTEFSATLKLPEDYAIDGHNWAKCLFAGFPEGTAPGAGVWIDVSGKDAFYLAEEQPYDIVITNDNPDAVIRRGDSVDFCAELVNQIGTQGGLKQDFDWAVVNTDGEKVRNGFTIKNSGVKATIEIAENTEPGKYRVFAICKQNKQMMKSVKIDVKRELIKDKEAQTPENLIRDNKSFDFAEKNSENVAVTRNDGYYSMAALAGIAGTDGLRVKKGDDGLAIDYKFSAGESYVIKARARKTCEGDVYFNAAIGNGMETSMAYSKEYGKEGLKLTDQWQDFGATYTVLDSFDPNAENVILLGFADGTQKGAAIDLELSVYIAKESAQKAEITAKSSGAADMSSDYILSAVLLNQAGVRGNLDGDFDWYILEKDQSTVSDDVTTEKIDSEKIKLCIDIYAAPGDYFAVAESARYGGIRKVFKFTVDKPSAKQCVVDLFNTKSAEDLKTNMPEYLKAAEIDGELQKADAETLSRLIVQKAKDEKFSETNLTDVVKSLAVISLYCKNPQDVTLYDANGNFVYAAELGADKYCDGTTLKTVMDEIISDSARIDVQKALVGGDFPSDAEFYKSFAENLMLKAIANPKTMGSAYVQDILTSENAAKADMNIQKYVSLKNKASANAAIARKTFTKQSLETLISKLSEPSGGGNGGNGGNGGGGGTPVSPAEIENTPSTAPAEPGQTERNFSDVDSSHWAFDEIYHLKKLGVISGVDEEHFVPEGQVTREQFVKMFIDAFGYQKTNSELSFSDVSQDAWYAEYICAGIENGLINGVSKDRFGVGMPISREDICVIAMRAMKGESPENAQTGFSDDEEISDYARDAVAYLSDYGVINGFSDGSFRPKGYLTRAQAAKIICTIINLGGAVNEK